MTDSLKQTRGTAFAWGVMLGYTVGWLVERCLCAAR